MLVYNTAFNAVVALVFSTNTALFLRKSPYTVFITYTIFKCLQIFIYFKYEYKYIFYASKGASHRINSLDDNKTECSLQKDNQQKKQKGSGCQVYV